MKMNESCQIWKLTNFKHLEALNEEFCCFGSMSSDVAIKATRLGEGGGYKRSILYIIDCIYYFAPPIR